MAPLVLVSNLDMAEDVPCIHTVVLVGLLAEAHARAVGHSSQRGTFIG